MRADGLLRPLWGLITLMPAIIEFSWRYGDRKRIMQTWVLAADGWGQGVGCCLVVLLGQHFRTGVGRHEV
jgi:hypothetical protein